MPTETASPPVTRILILAPTPFFGDRGCHVRILEEAQALKGRGVEVLVATYPTGADVPGLATVRSRSLPGVRASALGPNWARPLLDLLLLITAWRATRRFKPQVLHAHLHEGVAIGAIVRLLTGVPLVADLQGSLTEELIDHQFVRRGGLAARCVAWIERRLVRLPDAVLGSAVSTLPLIVSQGVTANRVCALPDVADLDRFRPQAPDAARLATLGLTNKRVVVFLGVLTPYQGVDLLIDAMPEVVRRIPDVHFLVMGYPNVERYREMARARGLERVTTFPGRIPYEEAGQWISLGSVAVSAKQSLTEANGKLLNYMACGLPVVATDTPVNRELLGEHGVFVPVDDSVALAARLVELLADPTRAQTVGAALRARAETEFGSPALGGRLLEIYARVMAHEAPADAI